MAKYPKTKRSFLPIGRNTKQALIILQIGKIIIHNQYSYVKGLRCLTVLELVFGTVLVSDTKRFECRALRRPVGTSTRACSAAGWIKIKVKGRTRGAHPYGRFGFARDEIPLATFGSHTQDPRHTPAFASLRFDFGATPLRSG